MPVRWRWSSAPRARGCGSGRAADREFVLGVGAETFVDLDHDRLEDIGEVDLVLDVIGGQILYRSAALVRPTGAVVSIVEPPRIPADNGRAVFFVVEPDRAGLVELERRLRDGRLCPRVGTVYPLAHAKEAFAPAQRPRGKSVIRVADEGPGQ